MVAEPISTAYFINPFLTLLGNGSVKTSLQQQITLVVFYAVRVVSDESRRVVLPVIFVQF
jgi:hypothetical protein